MWDLEVFARVRDSHLRVRALPWPFAGENCPTVQLRARDHERITAATLTIGIGQVTRGLDGSQGAEPARPPARARAVTASRCTKRRHPQFAASTCCRSRVVSQVVRVSVSFVCVGSRTRAGAGGKWIGAYIVRDPIPRPRRSASHRPRRPASRLSVLRPASERSVSGRPRSGLGAWRARQSVQSAGARPQRASASSGA